ncbi:hypothetical protein Cob_v001027 [Colletotrichum orbiculare MAFF 240422]|uniref:Uncharacterized protein n=1 Tax=Colletotrichum orbiculare (strain 104-T / ATCC 96160 / CBS 514.97 / LARS 414 / MAFF 240422) TaxID=1213857 RepID=A0A484G6U5_COLOR|nr:hypothetical protein Cob_v001027 [Colletotrichum orbiculare MAFF 240422]
MRAPTATHRSKSCTTRVLAIPRRVIGDTWLGRITALVPSRPPRATYGTGRQVSAGRIGLLGVDVVLTSL